MAYRLTTIRPCGQCTRVRQDSPPTLEQLQAAVGGYIQLVPLLDRDPVERRGLKAFCNEDGKISSPPLPLNQAATEIWARALAPVVLADDYLVGPVVFVQADTDEELWAL